MLLALGLGTGAWQQTSKGPPSAPSAPLTFKDGTALALSCMADYGGPVFPFLAVGGYKGKLGVPGEPTRGILGARGWEVICGGQGFFLLWGLLLLPPLSAPFFISWILRFSCFVPGPTALLLAERGKWSIGVKQ